MTTPTLTLTDSHGVEQRVQCELPRPGTMRCWAWLPERRLVAKVNVSLTALDVYEAHVESVDELQTADGAVLGTNGPKMDLRAAAEAAADALDFVILRLGLLPEVRRPPCGKTFCNGVHLGRHAYETNAQRDVLVEAQRVLTPIADMRRAEVEAEAAWNKLPATIAPDENNPNTEQAEQVLRKYVLCLCDEAETWSRQRAEQQGREALPPCAECEHRHASTATCGHFLSTREGLCDCRGAEASRA